MPSDEWWANRYARSRESALRSAAQSDVEWSRLEGPPAGSTFVHHRDGRRFRVRTVGPGESANHGCLVPTAGVLTALATRGGAIYENANEGWLVVVDSKTTRWHRYKVLRAWPVPNGPTAGSVRDGVVAHLTNGDDVAMIDTWPDWPERS